METACSATDNLTLPDAMPVMVIQECRLFPGCLLPLFVFEERYRHMLAGALGEHRMFCIGNRDEDDDDAPIHPISTAGLVRACVKQEDGTSQLLLQGMTRIRLKGWKQIEPFRIAEIERVQTDPGSPGKITSRKDKALKLFAKSGDAEHAKKLCDFLTDHDNAELVCDVLSYHFTRCPKLQQKLLEELSLVARYDLLIGAMEQDQCD